VTTPAANADNRPKWTAGEIVLVILLVIAAAALLYVATRGTGAVGTGMF
jgi:hypothetical protein